MNDRNRETTRTRCARAHSLSGSELALILLMIAILFAAAVLSGRTEEITVGTTRVRVENGDTLWSIAQRHPVEGLSTSQTARLLARINDLSGSTIVAGASIDVPDVPVESRALAFAMR